MSVFQWVIDNAESVSMNRLPVVASTTARDGTTRSVSRGNAPWKFDVKVADGIPWTQLRGLISQAETKNKVESDSINFAHSGYDWLVKYQGDFPDYAAFVCTWNQGQSVFNVFGGSGGDFRFRAGDFVQLGATGNVYTVAEDTPSNAAQVRVHRPIVDASGTGSTLFVAENCNWEVRCTNFPQWTLMARDQVSWDGMFTFVEDLL